MFGYRPENGDLATAFEISLANHANCLQIYLAKILDTAQPRRWSISPATSDASRRWRMGHDVFPQCATQVRRPMSSA